MGSLFLAGEGLQGFREVCCCLGCSTIVQGGALGVQVSLPRGGSSCGVLDSGSIAASGGLLMAGCPLAPVGVSSLWGSGALGFVADLGLLVHPPGKVLCGLQSAVHSS